MNIHLHYHARFMFGSHLSIAGGLVNALHKAEELGMECVQVFTKNQRQWKVAPLREHEQSQWLEKLKQMKWDPITRNGTVRRPVRVVSHNSYLINLASPEREQWRKSVDLQRIELERCEALHIPFCVAHPGAHKGDGPKPGEALDLDAPPSRDEQAGLDRIVKALNQIHRDLAGYRTVTCLETTVGSGTNLGYAFDHLAYVREHVNEPERIGFCFDTCHVTAAGYDMSSERKARAVLRRWHQVCGMSNLKVIHVNDSVGSIGSRRDRHAHIGEGTCGQACFRTLVNRRALRRVPMILETPKQQTPNDEPWDVENVRRLKRLVRKG